MQILRMIMSAGAGLLVVTMFGSFICVTSNPIVGGNCVIVDYSTMKVLTDAGFLLTFAGASISGEFVYLLTGKWKLG